MELAVEGSKLFKIQVDSTKHKKSITIVGRFVSGTPDLGNVAFGFGNCLAMVGWPGNFKQIKT